MKRRNVQQAFVGEPSAPTTSAMDDYAEGDEAVDIEVRGGKVQLVAPAGTPDDRLFEELTFLGGELELEDGRILSFQIQGEAIGAQVAVKPFHEADRGAGLSSIPDIPSGT